MLAVIDERRAARAAPAPTRALSPPEAATEQRQTTQAMSFAAGLAAATSRR